MSIDIPGFSDIIALLHALLNDASDFVKVALIVSFVYLMSPIIKYAGRRESLWDAVRRKLKLPVDPPHEECRYHNDMVKLMHSRSQWREIEASWKSEYIREAMNTADTMLDCMRVRMLDLYRGELVTIGITALELDEEYDYYSHVVDRLVYEMRQRGRRYFRENGYAKMTPQQIADYMVTRPAAMMSNGAEILDIFHRSRLVSRHRLRSINGPYMVELTSDIKRVFDAAIAAALKWDALRKDAFTKYLETYRLVYSKDPVERFEP